MPSAMTFQICCNKMHHCSVQIRPENESKQ